MLVVVAVGAFVLLGPGTSVRSPDELLAAAAEAERTAGCGEVENIGPFQPESDDQTHIAVPGQLPPLSTYPSVPPASGPHNEIPLGSGVYSTPPPMDRLIHSLEHGAAVVWYAPDAGGAELDELREFYEDDEVGGRVIVAPYDYPSQGAAGALPTGTNMALVAWHNVERCSRVSLAAAFDFTARYAAPTFADRRYLGEAPEAGAAF